MASPLHFEADALGSAPSTTAEFEEACLWANNALRDFKKLHQFEKKRLQLNIDHLERENRLLQKDLDTSNTITAAVSIVLNDVPLCSLSMPSVLFHDELAQLLSSFIEEYGDYSDNLSFLHICRDFDHAQIANDIIMSYGDAVVKLATKNHELRAAFTNRGKVDKKQRFLSATP